MSKAKYDKYSKYITEIDFSNFDSSTIINMEFVFSECSSLISFNPSNLDTTNMLSMDIMFSECSSLISLDISNRKYSV